MDKLHVQSEIVPMEIGFNSIVWLGPNKAIRSGFNSIEQANAWAAEVSKRMLKNAKALEKAMSPRLDSSKDNPGVFFHYRGQIQESELVEPIGWYYWDETQTNYYGPFRSSVICEMALRQYCEENLN